MDKAAKIQWRLPGGAFAPWAFASVDSEPRQGPSPGATSLSTSRRLLVRARRGDSDAINELFARHLPWLRRWARRRLPNWARAIADTTDIVQDVLLQTFRRLKHFEPQRDQALQAYLKLSVDNRIRDEIRRSTRHPSPDQLNP